MKKHILLLGLFLLIASCTEISCPTQIRYNEFFEPYAEDIFQYDYFVPVMDENNNLRVIIIQDTCTSCSDLGMAIGAEKEADALVATEEVLEELRNNLEIPFQITDYHYIGEQAEDGTQDITLWSIDTVKKATSFSSCCTEKRINATMNACWWKEGSVTVPNFRTQ